MGLFKDSIININLHYALLTALGFRYGKRNETKGEVGYVKTIHYNENEILWITIDLRKMKVYLYNESNCKEKLWQRKYNIPRNILNKPINFIDWLDSKIEENQKEK